MARANRLAHRLGRSDPAGRARAAGYRFRRLAENIAWRDTALADRALAEVLVADWLDSPRHRGNMLDPRFSQIGVGLARTGRRAWAVQLFGMPRF